MAVDLLKQKESIDLENMLKKRIKLLENHYGYGRKWTDVWNVYV